MIAKLAKTCALRISPRHLNFILSDKVANGGVSMWCELEQVSRGSCEASDAARCRRRGHRCPSFSSLGELLPGISNGRCVSREQCDLFRANIRESVSSLENCPECQSLENQADE